MVVMSGHVQEWAYQIVKSMKKAQKLGLSFDDWAVSDGVRFSPHGDERRSIFYDLRVT